MSRQKVNARSAQFSQFQNLIRGTQTPFTALSYVRERINVDDMPAFIAWLPNVRRNARGVFSGYYPKNISELRSIGPLSAVSFEREIAWAGNIIRQNSRQVSAFVKAATEYEVALVTGQQLESKEILNDIERRFGVSLWSIETRIALLQFAVGLEAQKAYASRLRDSRSRNDVVSFLAHYISHRNEPTTTPMRFIWQVEDQINAWNTPLDFKAYILFHLTNRAVTAVEEFAGILRHETNSALVDQYDTFVRLAQQAAIYAETRVKEAFERELRAIEPHIDDERIRRALFLLTSQASWLSSSNRGDTTASDAVAGGARDCVYELATAAIAVTPLDVDLWNSRAEALIGTELTLGSNTLCDIAIANARSVIGKLEDMDDATIALLKDGLNHRLQGFASKLEDVVWRELSSDPNRRIPSAMLAFLQARYLRPSDIKCLPTPEHRLALASALVSSCGPSASLHEEIVRANIEPKTEVDKLLGPTPSQLSPEAVLDAEIGRALAKGNFDEALALAQELAESSDMLRRSSVTRYIGHCLLRLGRIKDLVWFVANTCVENPELTPVLPVTECANKLDKETRRRLSSDIAVPIVLDLFSKRFEDRLDDIRDYAYEDFLLAHGIERPSELDQIASHFDQRLLTYYLRFICVPNVMQISSAFRGTRELEDERKSVLSLLVKLDPENAKDYETELRDVTRAQLIHRAVRQVERSKIYVDVTAIRRLFEKKHKETFQRYQSLIKAGIGTRNSELTEALNEALSGKPLPQEFLEVPKDEANDLLLQILRWLFEEGTGNPEHGLDCYLSMRIRHGTLSGQLRTPLEVEQIITQRAAGTDEYESNRHWLSRLDHLSESAQMAIDRRLARLSAEYDGLIARIANELIQIQSPSKPKGLFSIGVKSVRFRIWAADITSDMSLETFFDRCMELFWESVEASLGTVRKTIDEQLKPEVTAMFAQLEEEIEKLAGPAPTSELDRAVRTAQTSAQQALDLVKDWFRLSQSLTEPSFPIEDLIDVGLQCVRTIHREFAPVVTRNVPPLPPFADALVLFSDIFFIIFDNIRRHSGVGARPKVNIDITDRGDRLLIYTSNDISDGACTEEARAKIGRIKELIASGDYQKVVTSEGGTGLIKLKKLIGNREKAPLHLDFGFEDDRFFFVKLEIAKREIEL